MMKKERLYAKDVWVSIGMQQGLKTGLMLATGYAVCISLVLNTGMSAGLGAYILAAVLIFLFVILIAFVPALVIGIVTGMLISTVLAQPHHPLSPQKSSIIGGIIGICIAIIVNLIAFREVNSQGLVGDAEFFLHLLIIGIPSGFYIVGCFWQSYQLPILVEHHDQKKKSHVLPLELKETGKGG